MRKSFLWEKLSGGKQHQTEGLAFWRAKYGEVSAARPERLNQEVGSCVFVQGKTGALPLPIKFCHVRGPWRGAPSTACLRPLTVVWVV